MAQPGAKSISELRLLYNNVAGLRRFRGVPGGKRASQPVWPFASRWYG